MGAIVIDEFGIHAIVIGIWKLPQGDEHVFIQNNVVPSHLETGRLHLGCNSNESKILQVERSQQSVLMEGLGERRSFLVLQFAEKNLSMTVSTYCRLKSSPSLNEISGNFFFFQRLILVWLCEVKGSIMVWMLWVFFVCLMCKYS